MAKSSDGAVRLACMALTAAVPASAGATAVDGKQLVEDFIRVAGEHSMFASGEHWEEVKAWARNAAQHTSDDLSAFPIISGAVKALGDEHGGLNPTKDQAESYRRRYGRLWTENSSRQPTSNFTGRTGISERDLKLGSKHQARLIVMPRLFQSEDEQAYAARLSKAITEAQPGTCGYILDLRGNIGGDMWPMLAALSPLLGTGVVGGFSGKVDAPAKWRVDPGKSREVRSNGTPGDRFDMKSPPRRRPELASAPVAILMDDGVLSSGEVVTIAFRGRARTRSFGARTYGLSTANSSFTLADGAQLYLATGVYMDRNGRRYPAGIAPDQPADPADGAAKSATPALAAAMQWLSRQPGCGAKGASQRQERSR